MNTKLILAVLVVAGLSSCSTAYRIEQTPDDVYYSPVPRQNEYIQTNNEDDRTAYNGSSAEDQGIRRRINNRRLRTYNDYNENLYGYIYPYGYYPYGNNYYPYSPYNTYNSYPVFVIPKGPGAAPAYTAPRKYNLGTYNNPPARTNTNTTNGSVTNNNGTPARSFTKPNNGSGVGNFFRRVLSSPNPNYNVGSGTTNSSTGTNTPARTFEPSSRSSSPASSSSSSSRSSTITNSSSNTPVRSFRK